MNYGVKKSEAIKELILKHYPDTKILIYNQDISINDPVGTEKAFNNVNKAWLNCQVLITTPTTGAGIDFTSLHFDVLVGLFTNMSCDVNVSRQLLRRVRNLKDCKMFIYFGYTSPYFNNNYYQPTSTYALHDFLKKQQIPMLNHLRNGMPDYETNGFGDNVFRATPYYHAWLFDKVNVFKSRKQFLTKFIEAEARTGVCVRVLKKAITCEDINKEFGIIEDMLDEAKDMEVSEAHEITDDQFNTLKRQMRLDTSKVKRSDVAAFKKHSLRKYYNFTNDISTEWVSIYKKSTVKTHHRNLKTLVGHKNLDDVVNELTAYKSSIMYAVNTPDVLDNRTKEALQLTLQNKIYYSVVDHIIFIFSILTTLGFQDIQQSDNDMLNYNIKIPRDKFKDCLEIIYKELMENNKLLEVRKLFNQSTGGGKMPKMDEFIPKTILKMVNTWIKSLYPFKIVRTADRCYSISEVEHFSYTDDVFKPIITRPTTIVANTQIEGKLKGDLTKDLGY
jgi:hypothetical protein